jgi:hypothetical protein
MKSKFTPSIAQKSALLFIVTIFTVISVSGFTAVTVENQAPGPVKSILSQTLTARITDKSVLLDWNTISELNNSHFEVERSYDMNEFKTVGFVLDGFITKGTGKRYAFKEDVAVVNNSQIAYYRLKQWDVYGNISYSTVVKVQQSLFSKN